MDASYRLTRQTTVLIYMVDIHHNAQQGTHSTDIVRYQHPAPAEVESLCYPS